VVALVVVAVVVVADDSDASSETGRGSGLYRFDVLKLQ
jgi:hypothetical protein